jgi:cell division protein FtsW
MKPHKPDTFLLGIILGLLVLGTFTLFNASSVRGEIIHNDQFYFLKRHAGYLGLGLILALAGYLIHYSFWKKISFLIILFGFALMLLVFVPGIGQELKGAPRWIKIGSQTFQPVEIFKLCLVIYLASFFSGREGKRINNWSETLLPFLMISFAIALICFGQKSLGSLALLLGIGGAMYFLGGLDLKYVILFMLIVVGLGFLFVKFEPFRAERLKAFQNPEADPLGAGYQINQMLITIGSGGFKGVGLGHSRQKFSFLPETMSDSIFAIWAEETGFLGSSFLLILIGLFFWRGINIARSSRELYPKLLGSGMVVWLSLQSLLNIAANANLIPLSGIPLPFFSYGGSALLAVMAGCGILLNLSRYTVQRR